MITVSSTNESVQYMQLNGFVHVYIQRHGIAFVIDNYNPIRDQYYTQKYPQQQNLQSEECNPNVQSPAIENK
jgi:hypothetical protein